MTVVRLAVPCPDCGADWPVWEDRCPGCRLSPDDLAAADELLERVYAEAYRTRRRRRR